MIAKATGGRILWHTVAEIKSTQSLRFELEKKRARLSPGPQPHVRQDSSKETLSLIRSIRSLLASDKDFSRGIFSDLVSRICGMGKLMIVFRSAAGAASEGFLLDTKNTSSRESVQHIINALRRFLSSLQNTPGWNCRSWQSENSWQSQGSP